MVETKQLRRYASIPRIAAAVRTYGDSLIDRELVELADSLERQEHGTTDKQRA